ncbi:MAG: nucleotidyltransferase domain-containing protein [Candidatus Kapaibacterium sp.]|nr:MAG: nucleotidyltransferase domain-containing protein [Candidatus Kapabacteria bacterium]
MRNKLVNTAQILGLSPNDLHLIVETLRQFSTIERACVFGSRARGTAAYNADIDIAIFGASCTAETAQNLKFELDEELPLPYKFDVLHAESLTNTALRSNIARDAVEIYSSVQTSSLLAA